MVAMRKVLVTKQVHHRCGDWHYLFFSFYQPVEQHMQVRTTHERPLADVGSMYLP